MPAAIAEPAAIHHSPPLFAVRAVPGHEEDEALLKRTDLPAMGRAVRLWRKGTKLLADFDDVPEIVAKLIEQRAYTRVSAEFYEDFTAGGKLYGPVLRRVAMLGAEIPEVKTLADIPTPANGKLRGVEIFDTGIHKGTEYTPSFLDQVVANFDLLSRDADLTAKFAEAATSFKTKRFFTEPRKMNPLILALQAARKLPKKFSEKITSDAHKATWKKFDDAPVDGVPPEGAPAAVTREDMMGLLGQMGMDPAVLEKLDDEALAEVVRVLKSQSAPVPAPEPTAAMSAAPPAPAQPAAPVAPASGIPGVPNAHPSQVTLKFSEKGEPLNLPEYLAAIVPAAVAAAVKPIHDQLSATAGHVSKFAESQKKAQIDSDLDLLLKEGKVLPAEKDALRAQLMRADGVAKFSDGQTELDKQLALLKARPNLVKFSEVVKTGKGGTTNANVEKQKVVAFSESAKMQPVLKAAGKSPEKYVEEFEAAQKKRPGMTAKDFGVSEEYAA